MMRRPTLLVPLLMSFALMGCTLPRGAALQTEILNVDDQATADFAVYPVTRSLLAETASWPATGRVQTYGWIPKRAGPIGRVILPGDAVMLAVWDSDDNSLLTPIDAKVAEFQDMRVSENGTIFVPYVGAVGVSGRTDQMAREEIQNALGPVSPSAQVQFTSQAGPRHAVNLVSGLNRPGSYPLEERDMTVLSAISLGGGVASGLLAPQVRLLRGNTTYAMPLEELFKSPEQDTTLRNGDKIIIAETESNFLALGATGREDLITFPKERVTGLEAVSLMQGLNDGRANIEGVLVLREYGNEAVREDGQGGPTHRRVVFSMDLSTADGLFSAGQFQIMPDDVMYATESPITSARTILGLIGASIGIASQVDG